MTDKGSDGRLTAVRRLLERHAVAAQVSVAGMEDEIAAVRCDAGLRGRLAELAPEIRSLGFRYVALEPARINPYDEDS